MGRICPYTRSAPARSASQVGSSPDSVGLLSVIIEGLSFLTILRVGLQADSSWLKQISPG